MIQLPDGRYHWERGQTQPLCYECKVDGDLWRYNHNRESLFFCSIHCVDKWARDKETK